MADDEKAAYNGRLDPGLQVELEEKIAARVFDDPDVETSEGAAAAIGRDVLYLVLREVRPDYFVDHGRTDRGLPGTTCAHGYNPETDFCIDCINESHNRAMRSQP
jgi:hypothetical protein